MPPPHTTAVAFFRRHHPLIATMPFFASQDKQPKIASRPATSLLRRFNDIYKASTPASSSVVPKPQCTKIRTNALFDFDQSMTVSLFSLDTPGSQRDSSGDSESNSSRSDASSSRQTLELSPASPAAYVPPRRSHIEPLRPALKQTTSWNSTSTSTRSSTHDLHVSFVIPTRPDPTTFAMHPLFEYTHLDHAPISCDILYPPSSRSILDRSTRATIPYEMLDEPATEPALCTQLVLKSELFPWEIVVRPNASNACTSPTKSGRYPLARRRPITNLDVLFALYDALEERVTEDEWAALGSRSRTQRKISRAYEQRCIKLSGGWETGVRRIDWLDGRTRLVGVEMALPKDGTASETATLIFQTPA
ncbi:hypothetical protein DFH09DRAFT_1125775 [Mycena vulgaris]|nr:hypothetical protein DFH09DRAFT_1125775 [Mycena vulgaris]